MNKHPRHVPFRSPQDIHTLKTQLFSPQSPQDQTRAIQRILTLETKTRLPHTLLSTAHLVQILHKFQSNEGMNDPISLQLSATMCLIRFVNGLLDPSQQSQYAIPLNLLAKKIGLPSWFVELRHAGTHEGLPSLEMLEVGVVGAVEWLKENYWGKLKEKDEEEEEEGEEEEGKDGEGSIVDYKDVLRKYRRIRRLDINKFIKFGDSSEDGKEYWKVVKFLELGVNKNDFYNVVMFKKCIINEKYKWEQIKLLYEPLFLHLIKNYDVFVMKVLDKLMFKIYEFEKLQSNIGDDEIYNEREIKQVKSWCLWIVEKISNDQINKVLDILGKTNQDFSIEILKKLKIRGVEIEKIDFKMKRIQDVLQEQTPKRVNEDIDIFKDLENLKKRIKLNTKLPVKNFEKHSNWQPKPFGVI